MAKASPSTSRHAPWLRAQHVALRAARRVPSRPIRAAWLAPGLALVAAVVGLPALVGLATQAAPSTTRHVSLPPVGASAALQLAPPYAYDATWSPPPAASQPLDVALTGEGMLLADAASHQVHVYDATGRPADRWGAPSSIAVTGTEAVVVPMRVAVDHAAGEAYVLWQRWALPREAEPVAQSVWFERRDLAGVLPPALHALPFQQLGDIAWHAESGQLFVAADGALHRVDPATGAASALPVRYQVGALASLAAGEDRLALLVRGRIGADDALLTFHTLDGGDAGSPTLLVQPLAVARGASDGVALLVAPERPAHADAGVLVDLAPGGTVSTTTTAGALDVPGPPDTLWPWALDAHQGRVALTTALSIVAGERLTSARVHAVAWGDRSGRLRPLGLGPLVDGPFQPLTAGLERRRGAPSVAASASGLAVLDCSADLGPLSAGDCGRTGSRVLHLGPDLVLRTARPAPPEAIDVALDGAGRMFVASAHGYASQGPSRQRVVTATAGVQRLGPVHSGLPAWSMPCDCPAGGRVAAGSGVVYAAQPDQRQVVAHDPGTGVAVANVALGQPRGLWPSDVALGPGSRLFTADLSGAQVQRFAGPGQPEAVWPGGGALGPVRVTAGPWQDGRPVVVALMVDGALEVHDAQDGELLARWRPVLPDGTAIDTADVAIAPEGTLYLSDRNGPAIHVFRPEDGPVAPPAEPGPTPTPSAYQCAVRGGKTAGPRRVVLGETAGVTLTLHADCPTRSDVSGADIVLVIGSSSARSTSASLSYFLVGVARTLLAQLDVALHRAGAVFGRYRTIDEVERIPLAADPAPILARLASNEPSGPNLALLIAEAAAMLTAEGRPDALPVIVVVAERGPAQPERDASAAQAMVAALNAGILVYVVVDRGIPELAAAVGSPERYLVNPSPALLHTIYANILRVAGISMAGNLTIDDVMAPDIDYLPGSARPAAVERDARLSWGRSLLPATGLTVTYRVRPTRLGILPVNEVAVARYTDFDGAERELVYPVPEIEVVMPTATPTPSATPTPEPVAIYLPIALKAQCLATTGHVDVVLLVDASTSMAGENIAAAKRAAKAFVGALDLARDQAAVIGFNSAPNVAIGLSRDPARLSAAIDALALAPGTRVDLALREAIDLLLVSPVRRPANRPVVILLTDGIHEGDGEDVVREAERGRRHGMKLYAIRLGTAASEALLRRVADRDGYFEAPGPADLERIYRDIAGEVPCL